MADDKTLVAAEHAEQLRPILETLDAALGRHDAPPRPELWAALTAETLEQAGLMMDAAAIRARDLRRRRAMAQAAKDEAEKEAHLAAARIAEAEKALKEIEDNLVRPLCEGFGKGKTHQLDTGFARVALCRKPPSVGMTEEASKCAEDVVAMLPRELLHIKPPTPNKDAIGALLRAGKPVNGFVLTPGAPRVDWRS